MFLKTESFEHNGVTVTLSELSALQRIEHLALMKPGTVRFDHQYGGQWL